MLCNIFCFYHIDQGNKGLLLPGSLQWMTAGRGILHSEMPLTANSGNAHGLQLWINLAAKDKMCDPDYQELDKSQVPKLKVGGIEAHVITGTALGVTSPVYTKTPVHLIHFFLDANTKLDQIIPTGFAAFIYSIKGSITVGTPSNKKLVDAHHTITLTNVDGQDGITVTSGDAPADFLLVAGKPLKEPVVASGPFVMNTRAEIETAIRDFQEAKNRFEGARGWRSDIGRIITDHMH